MKKNDVPTLSEKKNSTAATASSCSAPAGWGRGGTATGSALAVGPVISAVAAAPKDTAAGWTGSAAAGWPPCAPAGTTLRRAPPPTQQRAMHRRRHDRQWHRKHPMAAPRNPATTTRTAKTRPRLLRPLAWSGRRAVAAVAWRPAAPTAHTLHATLPERPPIHRTGRGWPVVGGTPTRRRGRPSTRRQLQVGAPPGRRRPSRSVRTTDERDRAA